MRECLVSCDCSPMLSCGLWSASSTRRGEIGHRREHFLRAGPSALPYLNEGMRASTTWCGSGLVKSPPGSATMRCGTPSRFVPAVLGSVLCKNTGSACLLPPHSSR